MQILNMSHEKQTVVVELNSSELVKLNNALFHAPEEDRGTLFYKLRSEMILARDLCQYGHVDDFSLARIVECRKKVTGKCICKEGKDVADE